MSTEHVRHKTALILCLHVYRISWRGKSIETEGRLEVVRGWVEDGERK